MDDFKKYWGILVAVVGVCVGVAGWLFNKGAETQDVNGRIFDSPEQKVFIVHTVKELPSTEQTIGKHLRDSMDAVNRIKSRKIRDSLMILEHEARKHTDSINRLNADQMYQIKQELKRLNLN